ncbi:MAG: sulfotransferase [Candidatus Omnitrophica bacterium]|nr:sulfotransferase [Candidatus Omnitrophota bacterium]
MPNCIIIGAQKAATSSLHHYMNTHPDIFMSEHKELNFFCRELTWRRGLKWYKKQFPGDFKVFGESSPSYTNFPLYKGVAQRMRSVLPELKLIYLVRDPINRMISQYLDRVKGCNEHRPIEEAFLEKENNVYLDYSKYFMQISEFLPFFSKKEILVLRAEDLSSNPERVLSQVFCFLGVEDNTSYCDFTRKINVSDSKLKIKKPRKIVRYLLSDKTGARLMKALIPKSFTERMLQKSLSGEVIDRPVLSQSVRQELESRLKPDIDNFCSFCGWESKELLP